ncbi:MAG: M20/M25/M40 family metallo-hydrolase [Spirochaetales bacterium]|nr:M20/M25/M40 family metallo-hydrolase [Spirochaetales bacterium]
MDNNIIALAQELIKIDSVSSTTNKLIIELLAEILEKNGFTNEILIYSNNNEKKFNLIAHRGNSSGLAFLMHSDTVPLASNTQLEPFIENNKLFGRGACDMKGPISAGINAIIDSSKNKNITVIVTADEETGCEGADFIVKNSKLLKKYPPLFGITTEPTELKPVYAHKGLVQITVTANGIAAHSSTGLGDSANFKITPFLFFISGLREKYENDKSYQNSLFTPPTNTLNMTITDFNCALNVTASKSRCKICFRAMPNAKTDEIITEIENEAKRLNLDVSTIVLQDLYTDPKSKIVQLAEDVTGNKSETVAYLTDASQFSPLFKSIILGPGSIKQAHTENEFIDLQELLNGYNVYKKIIEHF